MRAYVFNTLLQDKAVKDRLRSYPNWLAARNLANEASDESVRALVEAVKSRHELARRWYRLKARLLSLDRLAHYDRMAPVGATDERIPYDEARTILDCLQQLRRRAGDRRAKLLRRRLRRWPAPPWEAHGPSARTRPLPTRT